MLKTIAMLGNAVGILINAELGTDVMLRTAILLKTYVNCKLFLDW